MEPGRRPCRDRCLRRVCVVSQVGGSDLDALISDAWRAQPDLSRRNTSLSMRRTHQIELPETTPFRRKEGRTREQRIQTALQPLQRHPLGPLRVRELQQQPGGSDVAGAVGHRELGDESEEVLLNQPVLRIEARQWGRGSLRLATALRVSRLFAPSTPDDAVRVPRTPYERHDEDGADESDKIGMPEKPCGDQTETCRAPHAVR